MSSIADMYFFPELDETHVAPRPIAPFDPRDPAFAFALFDCEVVLETLLQPSLVRLTADRFSDDPAFLTHATDMAKFMALASSMYTGPFDIVRWMAMNAPREYFSPGDNNHNMFVMSVGVFAFMAVGTVSHGHGFIRPGGFGPNFASIFRFSNTTSDVMDRGQNLICVAAMMMSNMSVEWQQGQTRWMWSELKKLDIPTSWWSALGRL